MEERVLSMICVGCPVGCDIKVTVRDKELLSVEGNACPRAVQFARTEIANPVRVFATTVRTDCTAQFWKSLAQTGCGRFQPMNTPIAMKSGSGATSTGFSSKFSWSLTEIKECGKSNKASTKSNATWRIGSPAAKY